jgi:hypothetical protein
VFGLMTLAEHERRLDGMVSDATYRATMTLVEEWKALAMEAMLEARHLRRSAGLLNPVLDDVEMVHDKVSTDQADRAAARQAREARVATNA